MQQENLLLNKAINSLRGVTPFTKDKLYLIVNAYLAAYANNYLDVDSSEELLEFCETTNSYLAKGDVREIRNLFKSLSKNDIKNIVLRSLSNDLIGFKDYAESTNDSIFEIVGNLIDFDSNEHIFLDLGSGDGNVLAKVLLNCQKQGRVLKNLIGIEINSEQAKMSQMALDILSDGSLRPKIIIGNAMDKENITFTRGYCFPPFGVKQFIREKTKQSKLFKKINFSMRNTPEWLFIDTLLSGLSEDGKAVAIVSGRALFNSSDKDYRSALIESGLLEGIIELPNGSLNFTGLKPYILVFSHGNKVVKLVDASGAIDAKTKRFNDIEVISDKVLSLYNSVDVPTKDINILKDFNNLVPSSALLDVDKPKNGKPLGEIADVFTGNQYTLGVFEKNGMLSTESTGYRILTSSDIENGFVAWNRLRSIKYEEEKFDKYAVKKNDVVVTSKSSKVKTVVVDIEPKEKILVTGGMIIVRPNTELLDPTYLKIFLDSEQGQEALKSIQKGATIITINAKDLSSILIPLIDIKKQVSKAQKYNEMLTTFYALKQEARKLENALKNFYLDESEEL